MDDYLKALKIMKEDFITELNEYLQHTSLSVLKKNFDLYFKENDMKLIFDDFIIKDNITKNVLVKNNFIKDITNDDKLADNETIYVKDTINIMCKDFKKICDKCGYYIANHKIENGYYLIRDSLQQVDNEENIYFHLSTSDSLDKTGIKPQKSKKHVGRNKLKTLNDNYDERIYLISLGSILNKTSDFMPIIEKLSKDLDAKYLYSINFNKNPPEIIKSKTIIYKDHAYEYGVYVRNYIRPEKIKFITIV